jgi:uncharacterized protein YecE (DUF72 family)
MTLHAGTSGWAYREWKPDFYPAKLPQSRFLEHYCHELGACEINATFYRLQTETTFKSWVTAAPEAFRFAAKAHRRITHRRGITPDEGTRAFLDRYLQSVETLGPRLGAILYQFPASLPRDVDGLKAFLDALPTDTSFAVEFRDDSWNDASISDLVAAAGGAVCVSDETGDPPAALPPGPIGYVRMRVDRYTAEQRESWRNLLTTEALNRDVFAFVKHEGIPAADPYGGIGLARWLDANA